MIGVEISPAAPLPLRHSTPEWMPAAADCRLGEVFHQRQHRLAVLVEYRGRRPRAGELIDFARRGIAAGPRRRDVEREPFDRMLQPERARPKVHDTCGASKRVSEVTNHLVRVHLAPAPGRIRTNTPNPLDEIGAIARIPIGAHQLGSRDERRDSSIDVRSQTLGGVKREGSSGADFALWLQPGGSGRSLSAQHKANRSRDRDHPNWLDGRQGHQ